MQTVFVPKWIENSFLESKGKIYTPCTCYKEKVYPLPVISFNDHKWGSLTIDGPFLLGSARTVAFIFIFVMVW